MVAKIKADNLCERIGWQAAPSTFLLNHKFFLFMYKKYIIPFLKKLKSSVYVHTQACMERREDDLGCQSLSSILSFAGYQAGWPQASGAAPILT